MPKLRALICGLTVLVLVRGCNPPAEPVQTPTAPWRFAVVGDTRGTGLFDPVNEPALTAIARGMVADGVDLVLVPGDLVYGTPLGLFWQLEGWRGVMAPLYKAGVRVYPVRGNHEFIGGDASWRNAFDDLPQDGPAGEEGLTYSSRSTAIPSMCSTRPNSPLPSRGSSPRLTTSPMLSRCRCSHDADFPS